MKAHHLLTGLLVAANVLAGAALGLLVLTLNVTWPEPLAIVTLGIALGQLAIAAAWLVWGQWNVALRCGILFVVVAAWHYPVAKCIVADEDVRWWGGLLFLHSLILAGMLWTSRLAGSRFALNGRFGTSAGGKRRWQFTLGSLITLTTLAALVLGVGRQLDFPWYDFWSACLFCGVTAAGGAAAVLLGFRATNIWGSAIAPVVLCFLAAVLHCFAMRFVAHPVDEVIPMALVQGAVIALAACVLLVAGYRLAPAGQSGEGTEWQSGKVTK